MPTRDGAPLGAPCWIDLLTSDLQRSQEFYRAVFGWTFESAGPEYGGYVNASKNGQPVATKPRPCRNPAARRRSP